MRIDVNLLRRLIKEALLNAYEVLGVPHDATEDQIKSAWKKLALQYHPDRGGSHGKMIDINKAKDRLLNKSELFRLGPNIQGYEDPNAPVIKTCPVCKRQVAVKNGVFVNHYKQPGGPDKCPNSGKAAPTTRPPVTDDDLEDAIRRWQQAARERAARERERERQRPPPPPRQPPPPPPPQPQATSWRYFEYVGGTSRKFWEIKRSENLVFVQWGRIGSAGQRKQYTFGSTIRATGFVNRAIREKLDKGYREVTRHASRPGARTQQAPPPPPPPPAGAGQRAGTHTRPVDVTGAKTYKVYGNVKDKNSVSYWPHTRVKGQAYAPTGEKKGKSKFHQNDRVSVNVDAATKKAKVKGKIKDYTNWRRSPEQPNPPEVDHTQEWDPIEEVRSIIDEAVFNVLYEVAFQR